MNRNPLIEQRGARYLKTLLLTALGAAMGVAEAAPLNLLDTPLYLSTPVGPNVVLTFDDSGSMAWAYLPDDVSSLSGNARGCSHTVNKVHYDPSITYKAPVKADGTYYPNSSFSAAYTDGYNTGSGTVDLGSGYRPSWSSLTSYATCGQTTPSAAFYFLYDPTGTGCSSPGTGNDACYRKVTVTSTSAEAQNFANWYSYYRTRNLMAKTAAGLAFANFPMTVRIAGQHINNTTAGTGTGMKFTTTIGTLQQFCDNSSGTVAGCPTGSTAKTDFYTRLYNSPRSGNTPLITAMQRVLPYFGSQSSTNGAYRDNPGSSTSPERSCRQDFQILMTDGYWNNSTGTAVGNVDGTAHTLGDGTAYTVPRPPYSDAWSNTLADNSFNAWYQDLRTDLPNRVPPHWGESTHDFWNPVNDPATWQHVVTFTIGLGINGSLTKDTATYNSLVAGTTAWRDPDTGCPTCDTTTVPSGDPDYPGTYGQRRIDDLWHAALDSRGQYFSAGNPQALGAAFNTIVQNVLDRTSSASAVALNAGTMTGNNFVYQARFNSGNWSGQLLAFAISPTTGAINTTSSWDAGAQLNLNQDYNSGRSIITYKPSSHTGIPFRWPANPSSPGASELDVSQSSALNLNPDTGTSDTPSQGAARLDYIRGDASNEGVGNGYRSRTRTCNGSPCTAGTNTGWLGDIIDSAPAYVGAPPFGYLDSMEAQPYSAFRSSKASREPIVYVGANDGMLHGFNANTGLEKIAYVPSAVYGNLSRLTSPSYAHRYYVDGSPVPGDVFINNAWHTILVGGLRKGGQGIYALDITNPNNFSEPNAGSLALWEFTDQDDADLGYTFGEPVIAKMHDGTWAVILGNGYNNSEADGSASATGHAVLYILFIKKSGTGGWTTSDYVKIDTGVGSPTTPNGLAAPAAVDVDGDNVIDYIYAGDLQGNMWKFDVTSTTSSNWTSASARRVVFVAKDASNNLQPITTRPEIGRMPVGQAGYMVYFGTGRYLDSVDTSTVTSPGVQTFYGVWDSSPVTSPTRSNLLQQTVVTTTTVSGSDYRVISSNPMSWKTSSAGTGYVGWYLDLPTSGERGVTNPVLHNGRIIFTTLIPSDDPCTAGGDGWLMELDAASGGRLDTTPFDVNNNGTFDANDYVCIANCGTASQVTAPVGGQKTTGMTSSPVIFMGGSPAGTPPCQGPLCGEWKALSQGNPNEMLKQLPESVDCNYCRSSWRQIR